MKQFRVLVHAEVELAAIDGSTSWLMSISRCFAMAGATVDVMARNAPDRAIVLDELRAHPSVKVLYPNSASSNSPMTVARAIAERHEQQAYDLVLVRGEQTGRALLDDEAVRSVLWYYLVNLPHISDPDRESKARSLVDVVKRSRGLFAQTQWLREYLYALVPEAIGKTEVLPPMVPDEFFAVAPGPARHRVRLGYAGKFDQPWHTLEIPQLAAALEQRGTPVDITMHGDKVQAAKGDPTWHLRMRQVMQHPPAGVRFGGPLPRSRIPAFMASCDIGIGWRDSALDTSYEISTKLLEFSAAGVPVLCNDTEIHRSLFGEDYPLLVEDDLSSIADTISDLVRSDSIQDLRAHVRGSVERFSFSATATRLRDLLARLEPTPGSVTVGYIHADGYASDDFIGLVARIASVDVGSPKRAVASSHWLSTSDIVIADFTARALEALPPETAPTAFAFASGSIDDHGLLSKHRLDRLRGLLSPDPHLLHRARQIAPHLRTNQLDPASELPLLDRGATVGFPADVALVLEHGDLDASAELHDVLPAFVSAASGAGHRLRVVVLEAWPWAAASAPATAQRFARELSIATARVANDDAEIAIEPRANEGWMMDMGAVRLLGRLRANETLTTRIASYGAAFVGGDHRVPLIAMTVLKRPDADTFRRALRRRTDASATTAAPSTQRELLGLLLPSGR